MNRRCVWVVPSPRQHSITRKCNPLSRIWDGHKERMCIAHPFFLFIADSRNAVLHFLLCSAAYTHRHFHCTDTHHLIFHNHHSFKRLLILIVWFGLFYRNLLGSYKNSIKLKHCQCRKIVFCSVLACLYYRHHTNIDVLF